MTRDRIGSLPGLLACVLSGLLACAAPQWHRAGATAEDLERDKQECMALSGNTSGVSNLMTSRFVAKCLSERAWIEGPATGNPTAGQVTDDGTAALEPMSFDQCFERCRTLTDRTREQCFDTCLAVETP